MQRGVTLIELIIVVIIIGVLVSFAAPQYKAAQEKTLNNEAIATLKLIIGAEKAYRLDTGSYYDPNASDVPTRIRLANENLKLTLPTQNYNWIYSFLCTEGEEGTPADSCCIIAWPAKSGTIAWRLRHNEEEPVSYNTSSCVCW